MKAKQNTGIVLIAMLIAGINPLIDHFSAPSGILLTPIILTITTLLIAFLTKKLNPILKSLFVYCCIAINDVLIKLYGGGIHDNEGQGIVNLLLLTGFILSLGILSASIVKDKAASLKSKISGVVLFVCLTFTHFYCFASLGVGRYY